MRTIDWETIRYRGDAADVKELFEVYRVGDYLDAYEENRRQQEESIRSKLLAEGILLTQRLSPRIYGIFQGVCEALGLEAEAEIFCLRDESINAMAVLDVREDKTHSLVGITAAALERLEDGELASVLGHELGHFLFKNNRLNALISRDVNNPAATVLPSLGESLFLRWRKKAEVSADRVGLLACRDLRAAARGLMKAAFGLSERNVTLNIDALLAQIDAIKGQPELMQATFASHPLLPIRLKALELFARSDKAARAGFPASAPVLTDDQLEGGVDELMRLTRRYPAKPLHQAIMKVVALAGVEVLSADGEISDHEIKILIEIIHHYFTDEPDQEILTDRREIERRLPEVIAKVNELGDANDKTFILSRLADVALADGALMDKEGSVILHLAEQLEVPGKTAFNILVGSAQAVGFKVDVKLNRVADELRRSLRVGLNLTPSPKPR
jgi:Zn-dependent protease with chaperone function/uncharacterized tellurite resistance protein B-like protein